MGNFHARSILGLLAIAVSALAIAAIICFAGESKVIRDRSVAEVSPEMLPSLLIGPDELPWDVVFGAWNIGSDVPRSYLGAFEGQWKYRESWCGRPMKRPGGMISPDYDIRIAVAVADSPEDAARVARKEATSCAVIIPEITHDGSATSFSDRAWSDGTTIVFVRGNVVSEICMAQKGGYDRQLLSALAARLSRKIDAALAGKPEPAPILPLAADQELRVDLEGAWRLRGLGDRLWGDKATTIAIYDINGIPRSLPAKPIGTGDYVVPLRHLAAIIGPGARVKTRGDESKVTLMEKALIFNKGMSEMHIDRGTGQLDRPVEFAEGEVLVPLTSLVRDALGKRIAWERRGAVMVGRVE